MMEKKVFRAAYFDLDGTLIRRNATIDPKVSAKIRALSEQGVYTAIASGRPSFAAFDIAQELSMTVPSMFFSGSLILSPQTREIHYQKCLAKKDLQDAIALCEAHQYHLELYTSSAYRVSRESELIDIHNEYLKVMPETIGAEGLEHLVNSDSVLKLVIMIRSAQLEQFQKDMGSFLNRFAVGMSYGASHSDIVFFNLTEKRATREAAFAELIRLHNVRAEEVICFGDAEADLPFIRLAGLGVAMANAPESVRREAKMLAEDIDEAGVLPVLESVHFVNQKSNV
jgi:Cof subfamily protein (haloacid dehalogenase superfamily)